MNAPAPTGSTSTGSSAMSGRRELVGALALDVVAPLAVFYGLRAAGVDPWLALVLGLLPPGARAVWTVVTRRRVDALAAFTLSVLLVSVALSFVAGSPRTLLARDGWMTGLAGIWILATLLRTPLYYQAVRSFAPAAVRERAETAWGASPPFRRVLRVATAIWGVGLVADAAVRVVLAYTLPVDSVPLVGALQYVVVFVGLEVSSQLYVRRRGGHHLRSAGAT